LNKIFLTISIILISNSWNNAFAIEQKLSFAVSGIISDITVRPGQTVTAGTVLARLDLTQFKAKKKAFDAAVIAAELEYNIINERLEQIQQLYDDLSTSREELQNTKIQEARARVALEIARANAKTASWNLQHAVLSSPRSGIVRRIEGYAGLVVNPEARFTPIVILD